MYLYAVIKPEFFPVNTFLASGDRSVRCSIPNVTTSSRKERKKEREREREEGRKEGRTEGRKEGRKGEREKYIK